MEKGQSLLGDFDWRDMQKQQLWQQSTPARTESKQYKAKPFS